MKLERTLAADLAAKARQLRIELDRLAADLDELAAHRDAEPARVITPTLLTVEEGASALSVGRSRILALINAGELASVQIGTSRRIPGKSGRAVMDACFVLGGDLAALRASGCVVADGVSVSR